MLSICNIIVNGMLLQIAIYAKRHQKANHVEGSYFGVTMLKSSQEGTGGRQGQDNSLSCGTGRSQVVGAKVVQDTAHPRGW